MKTRLVSTRPRSASSWSAPVTALVFAVAAAACGAEPAAPETCTDCQPVRDAGAAKEASVVVEVPAHDAQAARPPMPEAATMVPGPSEASTPARPDASVPAPVLVDAGSERTPPAVDDPIGGLRPPLTTTHLSTRVHDPALIQANGVYYLFATGGNLSIRTSTNLMDWRAAGNVQTGLPAWISALGVAPTNGLWAPDVSYFGGKFRVYYAASTFGSNNSAIGMASNTTLDAQSPDYKWVDEGLVVRSMTSDRFNAIDPNVVIDAQGEPWLAFGSFWDGIKMRKLDAVTGKVSAVDTTLYALATRPNPGAIEAPSIIYAHGWYYLFVSFDLCCKDVSSTYRTMVGRSQSVTGPYVDATGKLMTTGAAVQLLATDGRYIGPGGGTVIRDNNQLLYVHHYYDGMANGQSVLQIHPLTLDADDWIVVGPPLWL